MGRTERFAAAAATLLALASPAAAQQTGVGVVDTAAARAQAAVDSANARAAHLAAAADTPVAQMEQNQSAAEPLPPPRPMPQGPPISAEDVKLVFDREVYRYDAAGRRDPFRPLTEGGSGPMFQDLKLRMILYSNVPGQSLVVLADANRRVYRLRRGESIGNITVLQISADSVVFAVEDFGVRRQEVLSVKPENTTEGA